MINTLGYQESINRELDVLILTVAISIFRLDIIVVFPRVVTAKHNRHRSDRKKKLPFGFGLLPFTSRCQPTSRHYAVDMRVVSHLLSPGM